MNGYVRGRESHAKACVIWLHGLGADGKDMAGLSTQLQLAEPIQHVFMDAPVRPVTLNNGMLMRAWYDIFGMRLTDREDREGIKQSEALIRQVIDEQLAEGYLPEQLFLAGFSQGGAMALYTGLHLPMPLAGIIVLSGYLPLSSHCKAVLPLGTPMFFGAGRFDQIVWPSWSKGSFEVLKDQGFEQIAWHEYPMEHSICAEEIRDISSWLSQQVVSMKNDGAIQ